MAEPRIPSFLVLGYSEAAMYLKSDHLEPIEAAICIHGQRDPVLDCECRHRVDLLFDDCAIEDSSDAFAAYRSRTMKRKAAEVGLKLKPPTESDIEAMIAFGQMTRICTGLVLFQCHAGISRSATAALIALVQWYGEGQEHTAVKALRQVRPAATPPLDIVTVADRLMRRDGKMLEALTRASP